MTENNSPSSIPSAKAAILFEYIKNSFDTTSTIATDYYAIGYIVHGNCRVHSDSRCYDIPEQCLYVLERGKHIIENNADCNGLFEQVVMHLDRDMIGLDSTVERDDKRMEDVVMGAVAENLSLDKLAERCYVSVSTFKRRFRKRYSMSPHRWFILRRLDLAYRMILATDISITEIARMCGFTNPSHFIAAFKRRYGATPTALRRDNRRNRENK